jgi:predicted dehydrogenase
MPHLTDLHGTVKTAIAGKRIGTPVFVRCCLLGAEKPEEVVPRLAQLTAAARDWLGQPLDRVYAVGAPESHVALTLEFRDGATALVSFARDASAGARVELMVLGNHGAICHDLADAGPGEPATTALPDPPEQALQALIEQALRTGKPEPAGARP